MAADLRLAVMSFPKFWDGATLSLNLLCVPSVDPLATPLVGAAPAFADHVPQLRAVIVLRNLASIKNSYFRILPTRLCHLDPGSGDT